jgi:hypothetical protein
MSKASAPVPIVLYLPEETAEHGRNSSEFTGSGRDLRGLRRDGAAREGKTAVELPNYRPLLEGEVGR